MWVTGHLVATIEWLRTKDRHPTLLSIEYHILIQPTALVCCDQSLPGTKQVLNSSVVVEVKHGPLLNRSALAASSYTTATAHHANSLGPNLTTRAILQIHMDPGWHTAYYHWHNLVHLPLH